MSTPESGLRIGDAERATAASRLAGHFSHGRLDHAELDERLGRVATATTAAALATVFADLPADEPVPPAGAPARRRPRAARARRRRGLALVMLAICIIAGTALALRALTHAIAALAVIALIAVLWLRRDRIRDEGSPPSTR